MKWVLLCLASDSRFDLLLGQLLRLKCQAYSTLSDSDEDEQAEMRLAERMSHAAASISPPKPTLVAPAALYLTAILEYVLFLCLIPICCFR